MLTVKVSLLVFKYCCENNTSESEPTKFVKSILIEHGSGVPHQAPSVVSGALSFVQEEKTTLNKNDVDLQNSCYYVLSTL